MICYEEFENPCTFVLKLLMQHVSPTGKKKREGGGKKTVYLFTTVKRQKNTKLLPRFPDNLSVLLKPC